MRELSRETGAWVIAAVFGAAHAAFADDAPTIGTGYNSYGSPGLIDMPVATSRPDGELAFSVSSFAGQTPCKGVSVSHTTRAQRAAHAAARARR